MITNTIAFSFFMLIYTSLASKLPPSISADKQFVQVEEGPSGLNKTLFTITAKELNGGNVEVRPGGLTNDIVILNGTNHTAIVTMKVFLKKALDRETKSSFTLNFSAVSNDQSLPSSRLTVSLFVLDINDEPPKFSQIAYRIELLENHNYSNDIGANVSATDPDNGLGGLVTYTLQAVGQASGLYNDTFSINPSNGHIELRQLLNYEKLTFYQYKIIATDGGNPSLSSTAELLITVKDVSDTPPVFLDMPHISYALENQPMGTLLYRVLAVDGDISIQNNITYSLIAGDCMPYLMINRTTGEVYTSAILDRDDHFNLRHNGWCNVTIKASEVTSNPSNLTKSTTYMILVVVDVNDNPPTFTRSDVNAFIQEDVTDTLISIPGGLMVEDHDQGENSIIDLTVYERDGVTRFSGLTASPSVADSTGHVHLKLVNGFKFDYRVQTLINLTLKAEDRGVPSLTSYCHVIVHVNETNISYPKFTYSSYRFFVVENLASGTVIGDTRAIDSDAGRFGEISYSLKGNSDIFSINSQNGQIFVACNTTRCLDRERQSVYHFTVEARDGGGKVSSVPVNITLFDLNDNAPIFMHSKYEFGITENSKSISGSDNISVHAVDYDEPLNPNSIVSYAILPRPDDLDKHFAISNATGAIRVVSTLHFDQLSSALGGKLELAVIAFDHGSPSLTSTASITAYFKTQTHLAAPCNCVNSTPSSQVHPDSQISAFSGQSSVLCQGQEGYIQCGPGKAIRILSAVYGRLSDVICPSHHVGSLTCRAPSSTDHAKWSCNGYRRCSLFADSSVFGEPCSGVNKYLEVSFHCVDQSSVNNIFG